MKVVLIGSGNLGWHLGLQLHSSGIEILQVFSRNIEKAKNLGQALGVDFITDLSQIDRDADVYLIAVQDGAIPEVADSLLKAGVSGKLIVHTSGATPLTVFSQTQPSQNRFGVYWPLQTFTLTRTPDFKEIPICVGANDQRSLKQLEALANALGAKAYHLSDEERATLHLAAVFVNNFTNHLFHLGKSLLDEKQLPFDLLIPIIKETVGKLEGHDPVKLQSGPASRGDDATINAHLNYLASNPNLQQVYRALTENIRQTLKT